MKKAILLLGLLLGMNIQLRADNKLTVEEFSIEPGEAEKVITINLENDGDVSALEFRLWLPDGVSIIDDEYGMYVMGVEDRLKQKIGRITYTHNVSANQKEEGYYHFMVFSTDGLNIVGNSGPILELGLTASADATPGEKKVRLTDVKLGYTNEENVVVGIYPPDAEFNCTIGEPADLRVELNEESTNPPVASNGEVDVLVKRTINANEWSTIVLPFAMTETQVKAAFGEDVELSHFTGYDYDEDNDKITINFQDVTAIEANHPYIIKVSQSITEFTADGVVVDPEDVPVVTYGWTTGRGAAAVYHPMDFIGTYVADFNIYNDAQRKALFLSGNAFYYAIESTKPMKAFRAYFDFDDVVELEDASSRITMSFADDVTGIRTVSSKDSDVYYNLQGQPVAKPSKGLYIRNNKVVIVK